MQRMRLFCLSAMLLACVGCPDSEDERQNTAQAPERVEPYRSQSINMHILVALTYPAADPNAASVAVKDYENAFREALNECGRADGNSFPETFTATADNCYMVQVKVFTDSAPPPYTTWSVSGRLSNAWVNVFLADGQSRSHPHTQDALAELAANVYAHFHNGWTMN